MESNYKVYRYLIELIKSAINEETPPELPAGISLKKVYEVAVFHDVANIAFYSIERLNIKPQDEIYNNWMACRDLAISRDINQSYAKDEILSKFKIYGIRSLEIQGTKTKLLYPSTEYRTMSDIDIIIDKENLSKAQDILKSLGYRSKIKNNREIEAFRAPNINIELHTEYFYDDTKYYKKLGFPFENFDNHTGECEVDINTFYLYSIMHLAKHYFSKGAGIRRILDVYLLNKKYADIIDKEYVLEKLKIAGLVEFAKEVSDLADKWFGTETSNNILSDMEVAVINSGVHGTYTNLINNMIKTDVGQTQTNGKKLRYILNRLFAKKKMMSSRYPILKKYFFLYPFCWLHRLLKIMFKYPNRLFFEIKAILKFK